MYLKESKLLTDSQLLISELNWDKSRIRVGTVVHPSRGRYSTALSGLNSLVYSGAAVSCKSVVQAVREKFENFVVRIRRERGSQRERERERDREDSRAKNWRTPGKKPLSIRLEFTRGKCSWNSALRWSTILKQGFVRNLAEAVSLLRLRVVADAKIGTSGNFANSMLRWSSTVSSSRRITTTNVTRFYAYVAITNSCWSLRDE